MLFFPPTALTSFPRTKGDRGDQPAQTARACREWKPSRCRGLYTGGYLNVLFAGAPSSRWSSVVAGGPRRPGSDLLSVRPISISSCFSTFSGADIPVVEVLESLSEDRPADSGKRSVGTLIGRSAERNSTGPPKSIGLRCNWQDGDAQEKPASQAPLHSRLHAERSLFLSH